MSTATTREVPRDQWTLFCDAFSRQHQGWLAFVEVIGADVGAQSEADALPFAGITADTKAKESAILLMLGDTRVDHITHVVQNPARMMIERYETPDFASDVLEIEDVAGTKTLLRFKPQIVPEMLDGNF